MLAQFVRVQSRQHKFLLTEFLDTMDFLQTRLREANRWLEEQERLSNHLERLQKLDYLTQTILTPEGGRRNAEYSSYKDFVRGLKDSGAGKIIWMKDILNMHASERRETTVYTLIMLCGNQQCTDPKDNIFGLLSLLSEDSNVITADYSRTPEEVNWSAIQQVLAEEHGLEDAKLLSFCTQPLQSMDWNGPSGDLLLDFARDLTPPKSVELCTNVCLEETHDNRSRSFPRTLSAPVLCKVKDNEGPQILCEHPKTLQPSQIMRLRNISTSRKKSSRQSPTVTSKYIQ